MVSRATSETMVWATRPHSLLTPWSLHVETGPKEKWRPSRTGRQGLGNREGNPAEPRHPGDGPGLPVCYPESHAQGLSDPCFQGAGPCQAGGQG